MLNTISIDVTYRCNLRCRHCYNSSGDAKSFREEMNDSELLEVTEKIATQNPDAICFCGGEPLLRKEILYKMAKVVREYSKKTSINLVTNGLLVTEDVARNLKESGFKLIQISIDGLENSHNWIRNNEQAFDKAINAIKILKSYGFVVGVACVPTKKNLSEYKALIKLCIELGVKVFRAQPFMNIGRAKGISEYILDDIEYLELVENLHEAKNMFGNKIDIDWGDPLFHIERLKDENNKSNFLHINAFGDLVVSTYIPIDFGNVKEKRIEEYLSAGILEVNKLSLVKEMLNMVKSTEDMDIVNSNPNMPIFGVEENIHFDLLEGNIDERDRELCEKLFNKVGV